MSGFKNCPSVAEFKVGMRVQYDDEWFNVVFVDTHGDAYCAEKEGGTNELVHFNAFNINLVTLDLSVPWVGREYIEKSHPSVRTRVLMVDEDSVVSSFGWAFLSRGMFLDQFEPAPLPGPQPVQPGSVGPDMSKAESGTDAFVGDVCKGIREGVKALDAEAPCVGAAEGWRAGDTIQYGPEKRHGTYLCPDPLRPNLIICTSAEGKYIAVPRYELRPLPPGPVKPWQPRINEPCGHRDSNGEISKVTPLGLNGSERVWFHREYDLLDDAGEIGWVEDLCPWLTEPQVKNGDYVELRWKNTGQVARVGVVVCSVEHPERFRIEGFPTWYTAADVTINKLVPEGKR